MVKPIHMQVHQTRSTTSTLSHAANIRTPATHRNRHVLQYAVVADGAVLSPRWPEYVADLTKRQLYALSRCHDDLRVAARHGTARHTTHSEGASCEGAGALYNRETVKRVCGVGM
jgi:hypothetical protein